MTNKYNSCIVICHLLDVLVIWIRRKKKLFDMKYNFRIIKLKKAYCNQNSLWSWPRYLSMLWIETGDYFFFIYIINILYEISSLAWCKMVCAFSWSHWYFSLNRYSSSKIQPSLQFFFLFFFSNIQRKLAFYDCGIYW